MVGKKGEWSTGLLMLFLRVVVNACFTLTILHVCDSTVRCKQTESGGGVMRGPTRSSRGRKAEIVSNTFLNVFVTTTSFSYILCDKVIHILVRYKPLLWSFLSPLIPEDNFPRSFQLSSRSRFCRCPPSLSKLFNRESTSAFYVQQSHEDLEHELR